MVNGFNYDFFHGFPAAQTRIFQAANSIGRARAISQKKA